MPGDDSGKLARPTLDRGTQGGKSALTVRRQAELGHDGPGGQPEQLPPLERPPHASTTARS
eukprot:13951701-Alexandrium_andersonii.AAC.1